LRELPSLNERSLVIYLPDLSGGGVERLQLDLAPLFLESGLKVTFLLCRAEGALIDEVPEEVRLISLNKRRQLAALFPLARYLRRERPTFLIAHTEHTSIIALWARSIARVSTRVVICQHNTVSAQAAHKQWQYRILLILFRLFLNWADALVAVSAGVADDLAASCRIARERITVIFNGVVGGNFERNANAPLKHPWFALGIPVIVAAGRMREQKDFATLIIAFATVARERDVRLVLLGEGPLRPSLQRLAHSLGVADRVDMPGFCSNPLPYMRAAAILVLSSRFEGFAMVLAEALACGTPVVSTDCPYGPSEILDHGRYGKLTPIGDAAALAQAILATLDAPLPREFLRERGYDFNTRTSAEGYLELMSNLISKPRP
jgi:glycosyltransferase involved in cell wall biosynthesis